MLLTGQLEAWRDNVGKPYLAGGAAAKPPGAAPRFQERAGSHSGGTWCRS